MDFFSSRSPTSLNNGFTTTLSRMSIRKLDPPHNDLFMECFAPLCHPDRGCKFPPPNLITLDSSSFIED